jgi:ankyrin repeat protein
MASKPTKDALHQAILNDSAISIEQALQDAVRNSSDTPAFSILMKAIVSDSTEAIKSAITPVLLEGKNNNAPILWAALLKKSNAVKALLECGATADASILQYSVKAGDFKTALLLVRSGIDISQVMQDCMFEAYRYTNATPELALEFIEELIARGYNINDIWKVFSYGLHEFEKDPQHRVLKLFIKKGANPNHDLGTIVGFTYNLGKTPLLLFLTRFNRTLCDKKAIEILLNAGANVNQKAYVNPTGGFDHETNFKPLAYAMKLGKSDLVELLLNHGATL